MSALNNSVSFKTILPQYSTLLDIRSGVPPVDYMDEWLSNRIDQLVSNRIDAPTDLSTATSACRLADIIALMIDSSGMRQVYIIEFRTHENEEAMNLLQRWIEQYGTDCDPDLDKQLQDLNANRIALRGQC